jgi:tetratricopeptide (TPR) repeat protein
MNRGNAKQGASEYGPSAAIADYDEAIAIREALRADLEPQGCWEMGLRNDLAVAYMNRGNAYYRSEHFLEAIQNWGLAAEIYRKSISRNWLSGGERLLAAIFYQLLGYLALEEWEELADQLLSFIVAHQQLEALWREQHSEIDPWREIVGQFAATVRNLTLSQRAAVLTALGENAEAVKQAFGWEE